MIGALGQSVWLDYIRRDLILSGELKRLIEKDGLKGMTSNPAIFEKAVSDSNDYDEDIQKMAREGMASKEIYDAFSLRDVQMASDVFRPVYDSLGGNDGYVSLEVNPHLAHDTQGTIAEARRLWAALDRPNVMIKVPATEEGLPAIRQLTGEGININVTLLFGLPRYRKVAGEYIAGIEDRLARGKNVNRIASVASFFLSRIDNLVDPMLEKIMALQGNRAETAAAARGKVAIASAVMAYQDYKKIFGSENFGKLSAQGARPQRVLWASTGTKNPEYSDIKYVEALIAPETINTIPVNTLNAYRSHGRPEPRLEQGTVNAGRVLESLAGLGINIDSLTQQLEDEGVEKFNKPYDKIMEILEQRKTGHVKDRP